MGLAIGNYNYAKSVVKSLAVTPVALDADPGTSRSHREPRPMVNAEEIAFWNENAGGKWATFQERIDAVFAPITAAVLAAAAPEPGEAVLDIGCGTGQTILELARAVGGSGRVEGVDVSRPMLDVARSRVREVVWPTLHCGSKMRLRSRSKRHLSISRSHASA